MNYLSALARANPHTPMVLTQADTAHLLKLFQRQSLTPRERDVLWCLAWAGGRDTDISEALGIRMKTVKAHLSHVLRKLEVDTRAAAAIYPWREGWTMNEDLAPDDSVIFYDGKRILRGTVEKLTESIGMTVTVRGEDGTLYDLTPGAVHRLPKD